MIPANSCEDIDFRSGIIGWKGVLASLALVAGQAVLGSVAVAHDGYADLVEDLMPSVVNINVTKEEHVANIPLFNLPDGTPFEEYFRKFMNPDKGRSRTQPVVGAGAGFIISKDGYIVTNHHVIVDAVEIQIETLDGTFMEATLVGADPNTDIALLKVESAMPLSSVEFGNSDKVRVGDTVLAIGNPHRLGFSVSTGIVSARNRQLSGPFDDFIQTDAAINLGNSGGPLFNTDGEVIGVNTLILSAQSGTSGGGSIGIGFSMASNVVANVVDQLREFGTTRRGWLGVRIQPVTDDLAAALGMDAPSGALVAEVLDGPAAEAGLQRGDVILTFDGKDVPSSRDLVLMIADTPSDSMVVLGVLRQGEMQMVEVELASREKAEAVGVVSAAPVEPEKESDILGIVVAEITPDVRDGLGLGENVQGVVVVEVDAESEAYSKGIRRGDLILEVDYTPIAGPEEFVAKVEEAKEAGTKSLLIFVKTSDATRYLALSLEE